jgi:hypothetical protein
MGAKEDLELDFKRLFGRCYDVVKFPLAQAEMPRLFNNLIEPGVQRVVVEMTRRGYSCASWFSGGATMVLPCAGVGAQDLTVHLGDNSEYVGNPAVRDDLLGRAFMHLPPAPEGPLVTMAAFEAAFGEHAKTLLSWARNYAQLVGECESAIKTCKELIAMINTAGQLRRMCPEMVQYLPEEKRLALEMQPRTSAVPHDWSAFPRNRVYRMVETMAKCWMIPRGDDRYAQKRITEHQPNEWASVKG